MEAEDLEVLEDENLEDALETVEKADDINIMAEQVHQHSFCPAKYTHYVGYCQNPNQTTTQPNITKVGFDTKMTLHHPPPLNVGYISTFTDPILIKL